MSTQASVVEVQAMTQLQVLMSSMQADLLGQQ